MRSESIAIRRMRRFLNLGEKQVLKISLASASKFLVLRQCRHGRLHHDATTFGFPGGTSGKKNLAYLLRRLIRDVDSVPGSGRSSGGGNGNPPGESHGQRSLVGYSPWGCKESDMTEAT